MKATEEPNGCNARRDARGIRDAVLGWTPNPARAGDPRWIEPYPAIAGSTADFVDIHGYAIPGELTPAQLIENDKLVGHQQEKRVLMCEFGAFEWSYPSITVADPRSSTRAPAPVDLPHRPYENRPPCSPSTRRSRPSPRATGRSRPAC